MGSEQIKESRRVLRLVQAYVTAARLRHGAASTRLGFVEVITHPTGDPRLNVVTPRKNTAWVAAADITQGLEALAAFGCPARFEYVEGLFPPQFAASLTGLGLRPARENAFMLWPVSQTARPQVPRGLTLRPATPRHHVTVWPTASHVSHWCGSVLPPLEDEDTVTMLLTQRGDIVGTVQITFTDGGSPATSTACIERLMLRGDDRVDVRLRVLIGAAQTVAHGRGASLLMIANPHARPLLRESGFFDCGSVLCYAQDDSPKEPAHGRLEQPVLTLR
jgi:hypothetical protein